MGSSGLGLTIVSELVKLHNGRVVVSSQLRKGTHVTVFLPYSNVNTVQNKNSPKFDDEVSINFLKRREKTPEYQGFNRRVK